MTDEINYDNPFSQKGNGEEWSSYSDFTDRVEPEDRKRSLNFVLKDLEKMKVFREGNLASFRRILDLGMGKGSLGPIIEKANPNCYLLGVDKIKYKDNRYSSYDKTIIADICNDSFWQQFEGKEKFDLIIAIGLPPSAINYLIINNERLRNILKEKGVCVLCSDVEFDADMSKPFELKAGNYPTNTSTLVIS